MAFEDSKIYEVGSNVAKKIPRTGHPVADGLIRALIFTGLLLLILVSVGSCARCSAYSAASTAQEQQSSQQQAPQGNEQATSNGLQPGDDAPEGQGRLLALERSRIVSCSVERVVDGDTIVVNISKSASASDAGEHTVRMIGIDAEDAAHPDSSKNTAAGAEAKSYLESLLPEGTTVWLERDQSQKDRYGRMLAYVWLADPTDSKSDAATDMLSAVMVAKKHAKVLDCPPDTKHSDLLHSIEDGTYKPKEGSSPSASASSSSASSSASSASSESGSSSASASSASSDTSSSSTSPAPSSSSTSPSATDTSSSSGSSGRYSEDVKL